MRLHDELFDEWRWQTGNEIGEGGVIALCDAMMNNTTLTALDIGGEMPW